MSNSDNRVIPVERLELTCASRPWRFARERRGEIERHFAALRRGKPGLWNGRVLLLAEHAIADASFRGVFFETDFASFTAWRDWAAPDPAVRDCFAAAALVAADGAVLLGEMGPHTNGAGMIYFPCGTPDPVDVTDGALDFDGSVRRELKEETGLDAGALDAEGGWWCVLDGSRIAIVKVMRARESADALRARVLAHLAGEREPELVGIHIVRSAADLDRRMPSFVPAFLTHFWSRRAP